MDIAAFAAQQLSLLAAERAADISQQTALITQLPPAALVRHGLALTNLLPTAQRTGFGGRTIIDLEPDAAVSGVLPPHGVRQGDIVRVETQPAGSATKRDKAEVTAAGVEGVVYRIYENRLSVAVDVGGGGGDEGAVDRIWTTGKRLWIVKVANEATFKRMEKAMGVLMEIGEKEGGRDGLVDVLFGRRSPKEVQLGYEQADVQWFDEGLNDSQKEAVRFALASEEVALIHGPPGTGKTQTLLEIILQLVTPPASDKPPPPPKKILVCGPSNISVDNIVLRLPSSLPVIRIGHPARLLPRVIERSLDTLTRTSEQGEIVSDVRREMDELLGKLKVGGKARLKGRARKEGWDQVRDLRGEYRRREQKCVTEIVVLATLHGAGSKQLWGEKFDIVIIDEGSQALEAQCWIPFLLTNKAGISKLILAGDPLQLPPTIKSQTKVSSKSYSPPIPTSGTAVPKTLETTLFSRLLALHGDRIKRILTTQYRMHTAIMSFPSQELYDNLLVASPSVASRLLSTSLPYPVTATEDTSIPLLFIDTQGGSFPEDPPGPKTATKQSAASESKSNALEARLAAQHVHDLISAGVHAEDIGVLTPYNAQVSLISKLLRGTHPAVEVNSVDSFQGREKEAVVFSLVRSNDDRQVGFLKDVRRINVAITRARCHLCVVGDGETVAGGGEGKKGFLGRWIDWLESEGSGCEVRYPDAGDVLAGWAGQVSIEEE